MPVAIFDFDGTLVDSGPIIIESARAALIELGYPVPDADRIRGFVGPPLPVGITNVLGVPADDMVRFRTTYRRYYTARMNDSRPYPGLVGLLDALRTEGWTLAVATSKREDLALSILDAVGLTDRFAAIAGADLAEENSAKAWVLSRARALLAEQGVATERAIMIGDRHHDIDGAAEHGLDSVWVSWGYGTPVEAAGASGVADTPDELHRVLAGLA